MTNTISIQSNSNSHIKGKAYAILLAFLPILMMYRFPGLNSGISTILVAVSMLYAAYVVITKASRIDYGLVFVLALYMSYTIAKSSGNLYLLPLAVTVHIAAISTGNVNVDYYRRIVENVSIIAAICVLLQQALHMVSGVHVPLIWGDLLIEELSYYKSVTATGLNEGAQSLYRPCAFFLEPAAFSEYVIFGLGSVLFRNPSQIKKAVIITIGLFGTTSGIGFVLAFAIWGWWYISYKRKSKRAFSSILVLAIVSVFVFYVLSNIPFFATIISRFTGGGDAEYNAIDGRLFFWDSLFGGEHFEDLMFGFGERALLEEEAYFTGFMKILFAYGIVGVVLYSIFLIYLLFHVNNSLARMYVIIFIGLLFIANLTGFIQMIFSIGTIVLFSQVNSDAL